MSPPGPGSTARGTAKQAFGFLSAVLVAVLVAVVPLSSALVPPDVAVVPPMRKDRLKKIRRSRASGSTARPGGSTAAAELILPQRLDSLVHIYCPSSPLNSKLLDILSLHH